LYASGSYIVYTLKIFSNNLLINIYMDTEMINEFYLLQESRSNLKYVELLDDHVYAPIVKANVEVTTWVSKRGQMLMHLEARMNRSIRRLRKKYLTF
jgi:hypothetical protein